MLRIRSAACSPSIRPMWRGVPLTSNSGTLGNFWVVMVHLLKGLLGWTPHPPTPSPRGEGAKKGQVDIGATEDDGDGAARLGDLAVEQGGKGYCSAALDDQTLLLQGKSHRTGDLLLRHQQRLVH